MPRTTKTAETKTTQTMPAWEPVISQAGNPFPAKLKPFHIDYTPPKGWKLEQMWPQPLPNRPPRVPDWSGLITTDEYLYTKFDEGETWPRFKVRVEHRGPEMTDAQYEAIRRDAEYCSRVYGVFLGMFQDVCSWVDNHETCPNGPCRRQRRCVGRRDEDMMCISIAVYPPCIPLDLELIWTYHEAVKENFHVWLEMSPEEYARLR